MALAINTKKVISDGRWFKIIRCVVDFDASYDAGGETLSVSDRTDDIYAAFVESHGLSGYVVDIDTTNYGSAAMKLKVFHADYDAVADGALIEVPDTTDLSALTGVRVVVVGRNLDAKSH